MDIRQQIARLEQLINFIELELPQYAKEVGANDLVALITNRVINTGKNSTGGNFSPYSDEPVAAYRFWGKSRTQKAEALVRAKAKAKGALSYKEFREINNLLTDKKNFEFSGEMFRKFGVTRSVSTPGSFVITIGGLTPEAERKLEENSDREGVNIIEPSAGEVTIVEGTLKAWLEKNAQRIING